MTRTAWVTGSAGGIGSAVCRRLRGDGYEVVGLDRVASAHADRSVVCDLGDSAATLRALAEAGDADATSVALVVHVAAEQPLACAGELTAEEWSRTLLVNVVALDLLVGVAREGLRAAGGAVVAVSSVHATATTHGIVGYATSKAALHGWVRAAAVDLGPDVRVNAVAPGAVDTAMLAAGFERWGEDAASRRGALEARTPLGRVGTPDDVADAVSWLAGPQSAFVTGSVLHRRRRRLERAGHRVVRTRWRARARRRGRRRGRGGGTRRASRPRWS